MAHIPKWVLNQCPPIPDLRLRNRGKVRDSYDLPDHPDKMLVVVSDRLSIFDFVLPTFVAFKGEVLNALSIFWVTKVLTHFETDLVAYGAGIDRYLPPSLRRNPELQKRGTIVKILPAPKVEDVVRIYLTGSGWKSYQKDGTVCGHKLPPGLIDGSKLPTPIYTPTTKAEVGHDEHISAESVRQEYGPEREQKALLVAQTISDFAETKGIILADTKFEFSGLVLADEKGTPDSSRFWEKKAWEKAHRQGKLPPAYDKQYVREWGKEIGIDKLDTESPDDLKFVGSREVPLEVRNTTSSIYLEIFRRLPGQELWDFQKDEMGVKR